MDTNQPLFSDDDARRFSAGRHYRLWDVLGCHPAMRSGTPGARFAVWAPHARSVHVIGDFNGWDYGAHALERHTSSGVWQRHVEGVEVGHRYKFRLETARGWFVDKADPFARAAEGPPATASVVWRDDFEWSDSEWLAGRGRRNGLDAPIAIYEMHLGSWMRPPHGGFHSYRQLAPLLADHVERVGFTHVEFLPVMEHPFYGSWGYQCTGYFAPTARYGSPSDFKYLVDYLHRRDIGVILDWVPSHFPGDEHGLARFDGTRLYEYEDERLGFQPDWSSWVFDYARPEVRSFLISSALFWLSEYHADALRVDAVASMLYRDYSRAEGHWIPNQFGGRENLEAIGFLRDLNTEVYLVHPGTQTIAEESTAWPGVSRPVESGGLGFGMKWDMGWMNDILRYMALDPVYRQWHHDDLTFRQVYAFSENFVLPLSHDEVVHEKGSLWGRLAGGDRQRYDGLRALLGCMYAQPGKKLLFMGGELAQRHEWSHEAELDWAALQDRRHLGVLHWVSDLNRLYRAEPALHELDCDSAGFEWVAPDDHRQNVVSFLRRPRDGHRPVLVICNFSDYGLEGYRVGVPTGGVWRERLNSDAAYYGGGGRGNLGRVRAVKRSFHGRPWSIELTLPPLCAIFLQSDR